MIKIRNFLIFLSLIIISFGFGYRFGHAGSNVFQQPKVLISGKTPQKNIEIDFSLFWDVWDRIGRFYIDKKVIDPQKMVYGAISGMVATLNDPYTVFLSPQQNKDVKDDLEGKFEGIGAQLGIKDKKIVIVAPLKGSPAEEAGLRPGDWIQKVNDQETASWTLPEVVSKIRGPKNSMVKLTILQKDALKPTEISVVRDEIKVPFVEWEMLAITCDKSAGCGKVQQPCDECDKIVFLKLGRFGDQTADEWDKAVESIVEKFKQRANKIKGLVFDLRNNPGGYLAGSIFISSEFLRDGTVVIQEQAESVRNSFTVNRKGRLLTIPMVVLINKGSASASEIVAGALKERNRAKLVGETTFGKGSIQEAQELPQGAGIHITTAKWLLPSGKWINGSGLTPDILVENNDANPDEDKQLNEAINLLMK